MDCSFKLFAVLILIITCHFIDTVSSANLFGINFDAPKNVIRQGVEKLPQFIERIPFLNQNSNGHITNPQRFPENNQFSDNSINDITTVKNQNSAYYSQAPVTHKNGESSYTKGDNRPLISKIDEKYAQRPVFAKNQGSYSNKDDARPAVSKNDFKYVSDQLKIMSETTTEYNTDYTTTTDDEWTTTDEPLNRIGTNPAVVASILG